MIPQAVDIPFATIKATDFRTGDGAVLTTTLVLMDQSNEVFTFKLKCDRDLLQRVCASRVFVSQTF